MLEFQENTRKEIWRAKKLIYEGDEHTKKSFIFTLVSIVSFMGGFNNALSALF